MRNLTKSIDKSVFYGMVIVAVVTIIISGGLAITYQYLKYRSNLEKLRSAYLEDQKELVRNEVEKALDYILYMKSNTEARLQESLRGRTHEADAIAGNIYQQNNHRLNSYEIGKMIKDALRPIRFNSGRGYFFATDMAGIEQLFADRPELEGRNMLTMQDTQGRFVVRDMIRIVKDRKEGFYQYTWTKPDSQGKGFPKIAYVKYFEPLDWLIGTGEYLDDVESDIQKEILERIGKIRFGKNGYIFVVRFDGVTLMNDTQRDLIGKNIWELTDPNGVKVIQAERKAAENPDGGFIQYAWVKPSRKYPVPKISFVKGIPDWQWMVGAGVYLDEVETVIQARKEMLKTDGRKEMVRTFLLLLLLLLFTYPLTRLLSRRIRNSFQVFSDFFERAATESTKIDSSVLNFEEFRNLAVSVNRMVDQRLRALSSFKKSEELFRQLTENIREVFWVCSVDWKELYYVSPAFQEIWGIPVNRALEDPPVWLNSVIPEDRDMVRSSILESQKGKAEISFSEYRIIRPDGALRWIQARVYPIRDENGNAYRIAGIAEDITERRDHLHFLESLTTINNAIQQDMDSEKMLTNILASTRSIFVADRAWLVYPHGPEAPDLDVLFEVTNPEYPGARERNLEIRMAADMLETMQIALDAEHPVTYGQGNEYPLPKAVAEGFDVQAQIMICLRPRSDKVWLFGLHQCSNSRVWSDQEKRLFNEIGRRLTDAIDSMMYQQKLADTRNLLHSVFEQSPIPMAVVEMDTTITVVNPACRETLGITEEDIEGKKLAEIEIPWQTHTGAGEKLESSVIPLLRALQGERIEGELFQVVRSDGTIRWVVVSANPVQNSKGRQIAAQIVFPDVTERILAEKRQTKLEAQLQHSYKMEAIGTLAGGIAHDFNNMLGIIIGNTELALEDIPEWNPAHIYLKEIKTASQRASGVVRQILSFSRKTKQEFKPVSVVSVIKDAFQLLRSTIPATIDIRMNFNAAMDTILADPIQIHQVVMNLCINASQAMEETGGILEITTENIADEEDNLCAMPETIHGNVIRLRIRDTGSGIASDLIGRIFDPYFTTKEVGKGSGMGLAVVHGIVQNHNGIITVESVPGEGATFTLLFPVVSAEKEERAEAEEMPPHGTESILFVDDEVAIARMTASMLERLDYHVISFTDPFEALTLFREHPEKFDLVITDMTMPGLNGVELCEKLMKARPDIPVIICSGHSSMIDEEKALAMGIDAFVMKPVQMKEIAKTIRTVLDREKEGGRQTD